MREGRAASDPPAELLTARGVSKRFAATQALAGADFTSRRGEIHALLGENGAGKSTLVKILSGALRPDEGSLAMEGRPLSLSSTVDALESGIAVVHQELSLLPHLTVAENLDLASPPLRGRGVLRLLGLLDRRAMRANARQSVDLDIDDIADVEVRRLRPAQQQLVEIGRALHRAAKVLILDEPTSSLPPHERAGLYRLLRTLREQGIGIIFITHHLEEALDLSDRITVLRDGKVVESAASADLSTERLVELMTGRPAGTVFPKRPRIAEGKAPCLSVEHLASGHAVRDVSFTVAPGEVVGLAGLVGSGRTETLQALFGLRPIDGGTVRLEGVPIAPRSPRAATGLGLALIPEDRQADGLMPLASVMSNVTVAAANTTRGRRVTRRGGFLRRAEMRELAEEMVRELAIKTPSVATPVRTLSGGNQQKVILARCLVTDPVAVLADDPTRGVAVGSKLEIYRQFRTLARSGTAVVLVSSEFEELVGLCDRIVILRDGVSVAEVDTNGLDSNALLHTVLSS